jgi:L-alanine-DL-glutamate epimerase-like enolase superfamily enzyme
VPWVAPDVYREVTQSTSTPIHTGEQIYLRENFKDLIEQKAVRVVGPDVGDVGGIAEIKWIAEYADLHGIMMAPHGIGIGVHGLAAQVQVAATMPQNYIAFEYPRIDPLWYDIVEGLPDTIVKDGFVDVSDRPGIGVELIPEAAIEELLHGRDEPSNSHGSAPCRIS